MLDSEIAVHVARLAGKDANAAYGSLQQLEAESADSDGVYRHFDEFAAFLTAKNGLLRLRGLRLVAANARWDAEGKLDGVLDEVLRHITDTKPIVARGCIQCLPAVAAGRPDLAPAICGALEAAEFSSYPDSMEPLLQKDRAAALREIER